MKLNGTFGLKCKKKRFQGLIEAFLRLFFCANEIISQTGQTCVLPWDVCLHVGRIM